MTENSNMPLVLTGGIPVIVSGKGMTATSLVRGSQDTTSQKCSTTKIYMKTEEYVCREVEMVSLGFCY